MGNSTLPDLPCICRADFSHAKPEVRVLKDVFIVMIPWTVAHQALLSMGFSGHEYWKDLAFSTPGDLPNPEMELRLSVSPSLAGGFFTH